jgi:hypothetical protein
MNVKHIVCFSFLLAAQPFFTAPARAQTENMSDLLEGEGGLNPDELLQDPLLSEGLEESPVLDSPLSQEEIEAIKNGGAKVPPVENGGTEPRILPSGESKSAVTPQTLSLPSGEASISGMGESFQPLLTTGAASMSIPIALPPGRAGVQPSLAFSYLSTAGNGTMGIGWIVSFPFIARQTDKGMPMYGEAGLSNWRSGVLDRFIYNGGEEIVPVATPSETVDCEMTIDYEIPYYDVATGEVHNEAVEKFPREVCGWWYFRTRLEGSFLRFFWNGGDQCVTSHDNGPP